MDVPETNGYGRPGLLGAVLDGPAISTNWRGYRTLRESMNHVVGSDRRRSARQRQVGIPESAQWPRDAWQADRLVRAVLDDPTVRIRAVRRLEAVVTLCRLLTRLGEWHFAVVALRFGLTVDDQDMTVRSPQTVAQQLGLSVARVAQLEAAAIADLQRRQPQECPGLDAAIYRAEEYHLAPDETVPATL